MHRLTPALGLIALLLPLPGQAFRKNLPETEALAEIAGKLWWGGARGFAVVDASPSGEVWVDLAPGRAELRHALLLRGAEAAAALRRMVGVARESGLQVARSRLLRHPAFGYYLQLERHAVWGDRLLALTDLSFDRALRRNAIAIARKEVDLDALTGDARRVVTAVLDTLTDDGSTRNDLDLDPVFTRRLVRHGWLDGYTRRGSTLRAAVRAAVEPVPVRRLSAPGCQIEFLRNAFGGFAWTLATADRCELVVPLRAPEYHPDTAPLLLAVSLPPGSDPRRDAAKFTAARVLADGHVLAEWSAQRGFRADPAAWRIAIPERARGLPAAVLPGVLPPHVPVCDIHGDVHALITAHGTVHLLGGVADADGARFLADATKALPDAAHLDLIGELLFRYAYDSPDPTRPFLLGNAKLKGEIHQTTAQTLRTACGGLCRGDCDDLAELYHTILTRQGKLAHVLDLPAHAAVGWVEKQTDGTYRTFVLHTQPPLTFGGGTAADSLVAAHRHFYGSQPIDRDQLPIATRFFGENIRSSWVLSHRIFTDARYAKTMLDVQRDWHLHTYRQGVDKMQQLLAAGDHDPANYLELAGLAERTGQWDEAAWMTRQAIDRLGAGVDPTEHQVRIVSNLLLARNKSSAKQVITTIQTRHAKDKSEPRRASAAYHAITLAAALLSADDPAAAKQVLEHTAAPYIAQLVGEARSRPRRAGSDESAEDERAAQRRELMANFCSVWALTLAHLRERAGAAPTTADLATLDAWLEHLAFRDLDEPGAEMARYAIAAFAHQARLGRTDFDRRLAGAALPERRIDHEQRIGGAGQVARDLSWIRLSVPYLEERLAMEFRPGHPVEPKVIERLATAARTAVDHAESIGVITPAHRRGAAVLALYAALLRGDEEALRRHCAQVTQLGDKWFRDDTTRCIGTTLPHLESAHAESVLRAWHQTVGFKPAYFEIAWTAFRGGGKAQALAAARLATKAFADRAFQQERDRLEQLAR